MVIMLLLSPLMFLLYKRSYYQQSKLFWSHRSNANYCPPHIPDDIVNYKPEKNLMGRDVVPAGINGGTNALGLGQNGYSFYMIHDALKEWNAAENFGLMGSQEGRIILGQITVKDGDVLWNGNSSREAVG
jgi:hypothetical protein